MFIRSIFAVLSLFFSVEVTIAQSMFTTPGTLIEVVEYQNRGGRRLESTIGYMIICDDGSYREIRTSPTSGSITHNGWRGGLREHPESNEEEPKFLCDISVAREYRYIREVLPGSFALWFDSSTYPGGNVKPTGIMRPADLSGLPNADKVKAHLTALCDRS